MQQNTDCAGDYSGDCAHIYVKSTAKCKKCGHGTRVSAHDWRNAPGGWLCARCKDYLVER